MKQRHCCIEPLGSLYSEQVCLTQDETWEIVADHYRRMIENENPEFAEYADAPITGTIT